jgi:hypothetical protein
MSYHHIISHDIMEGGRLVRHFYRVEKGGVIPMNEVQNHLGHLTYEDKGGRLESQADAYSNSSDEDEDEDEMEGGAIKRRKTKRPAPRKTTSRAPRKTASRKTSRKVSFKMPRKTPSRKAKAPSRSAGILKKPRKTMRKGKALAGRGVMLF